MEEQAQDVVPMLPSTNERSETMGFLIWFVVGGLVGWLASILMRANQRGIVLNMMVGMLGAFGSGWLVTPLLGLGVSPGYVSTGSVFISLVGAMVLVGIVHLFRRGHVRW